MEMEARYIDSVIDRVQPGTDVEKSRTVRFVISTASRDRHRTVLNMDNWHLESYQRNPIVGYQHEVYGEFFKDDSPDSIIGRSTVWVEDMPQGKALMAEMMFEPKEVNELAEKIFRKVLFGSMRAASVGFLPIGEGRLEKKTDEKGRETDRTYYFDGQELLEWSIVKIPSNPDAVRKSAGDRLLSEIARRVPSYTIDELQRMSVRDVLDLVEGKKIAKDIEKIEMAITVPVELSFSTTDKTGGDPNFHAYKYNLIKFKNG